MGFFFKIEKGDKREGTTMIISHSHKKLQRVVTEVGYYHCQAATEVVKHGEAPAYGYTFTPCHTRWDETWVRTITESQCVKCKTWVCANHQYKNRHYREIICCRCMWELSRKASTEEKDILFDVYDGKYYDIYEK